MALTAPIHLKAVLSAEPTSAAIVRRLLGSFAGILGSERLANVELVASELVSNAIRHGSDGSGEIEFEVTAERGTVRGVVRDCNPPFRLDTPFVGSSDGGFGLHIVKRLAASLSVRRHARGNEVHFSMPELKEIE